MKYKVKPAHPIVAKIEALEALLQELNLTLTSDVREGKLVIIDNSTGIEYSIEDVDNRAPIDTLPRPIFETKIVVTKYSDEEISAYGGQ